MKIKTVVFDMDGTLIRNTDSVRYLCILNDNLKELETIQGRENDGSVSWIEADYLKAKLIEGLELAAVNDNFSKNIKIIHNLDRLLLFLKKKQLASVLITSGPVQVAHILGGIYGFDNVYGSEYEVKDNKFTGKIIRHLGNEGKLDCLSDYGTKSGISLKQCVAIGDSESDIDIFKKCGRSIALNYSEALKGKASEYIVTDDIFDIAGIIESWVAE